jgi:dTMP kinase
MPKSNLYERRAGLPGKFITFEGCDGSGKTTQLKLLADKLKYEGFNVVVTREPGGSIGAEEIRSLILTGDEDRWSAQTELLLFNAARRDHMEKTVLPALEKGYLVLCDRFADTSRVYQGAARADLRDLVDALHELVIGIEPDHTILMDLPAEIALRRGLARQIAEDRFEHMGNDFAQACWRGFHQLQHDFPDRVIRVDAEGEIEVVAHRVSTSLRAILEDFRNEGQNPEEENGL